MVRFVANSFVFFDYEENPSRQKVSPRWVLQDAAYAPTNANDVQ